MAPIKSEYIPWKWLETVQPGDITPEKVNQSYRLEGAGFPRCPFRCVKNCRKNPYCLWGLGEKPWILSGGDENPDKDVNPELRREEDFVGIINLGTTCYVNALLQLWFHNPILRPAILNWRPSYADDNVKYQPLCLMGQLQAMFARMKISKQSAVDPTALIESLSLNTGEQQDAQEFAKLFMSILLSTLANEDPIRKELNRAFEGVSKYEMECKVCKSKYSTVEKFTELDLPVKDVKDTSASFGNVFTEEDLSGDNQYFCQSCNGKTDAIRRFQLLSLPPVLNFQLLRFIYDKDSRRKKKVTTPYSFPEFLDMSPYVQNSKGSPEDLKYQLTGYLVHKGTSASSGHYVAHILDIRSKSWLIFNDDTVSEQTNYPKSDKNGLEESSKFKVSVEKTGEYKSTGAYMLVYTQESVIHSLFPDPELPAYLKQLIENEDAAFTSECQLSKQEREAKIQYFEDRKTCVETLYRLLVPKKFDRPETATATDDHNKESTNKQNGQAAAVSSSKPSSSSKSRFGVGKKGKAKGKQGASRKGTKTKDLKQESELALIKAKRYESKYTINDMDFLSCAWLSSWLNQSNEVVPLLTTRGIRCPHNQLGLPSGTAPVPYKVIPSEVAAILYEKYGQEGGLRLIGTDALCLECVAGECSLQRKLVDLEADHNTVQELLAKSAKTFGIYKKANETMDYTESFWRDKMWVSKNSIKKWKGWVRSSFSPPSELYVEEITEVAQESNLFNEDIKCPHGNLCLDENLRRPVCVQTWSILQKYFPDSFAAHAQSSEPCKQCQADKEKNQSTVLENKKIAEKIKGSLSDLIKNRNRPDPYKSSGETYYFVNIDFVNRITSFIKNPDKNEFPCMVRNAELLCESHKKFQYPIGLIEDMKTRHSSFYEHQKTTLEKWVLATEEEWTFIQDTFSVDEIVNVHVMYESPDDFEPTHTYEPDTCEECSRKWMIEIHNELWQFQGAWIHFRPVRTQDSDGIKKGGDSDNDDDEDFKVRQPLSKKKKTDEFIRRSGRSGHGRKEKKVRINSDDNVKKLKHYLVKALRCQVFASDISLYYKNQLLDDDNATVSSLGIGPGALIEYKTEIQDENEDWMEVDDGVPEPETGFAGTMLQVRLSDESRRLLSTSSYSGDGAGVDSNNSSVSRGANNTQPSQNSSSVPST